MFSFSSDELYWWKDSSLTWDAYMPLRYNQMYLLDQKKRGNQQTLLKSIDTEKHWVHSFNQKNAGKMWYWTKFMCQCLIWIDSKWEVLHWKESFRNWCKMLLMALFENKYWHEIIYIFQVLRSSFRVHIFSSTFNSYPFFVAVILFYFLFENIVFLLNI